MHMIYYMNTQCSICYNIASYRWVCWVSRKPNPKSLCQSSKTLPTLPIVFVVEGSRFSVQNTSCYISRSINNTSMCIMIKPFYSIPFHNMPFHNMPFHDMLFHNMLFNNILFYNMLFYNMPLCNKLSYNMLFHHFTTSYLTTGHFTTSDFTTCHFTTCHFTTCHFKIDMSLYNNRPYP